MARSSGTLYGLENSIITLLLNDYGLKYFKPQATIEILHLGFLLKAPRAIIATPALIGNRSGLSWEPPSGNIPILYPLVSLSNTVE